MIAAAGPASTVRRPATWSPRNANWFVSPSTRAIARPRRLSDRRLPANATSTAAPTDARPAATHSGGAASSATRCTTNISPQMTHSTAASSRVSSNRCRQPRALTTDALPAAATRAPPSTCEPPVRRQDVEDVVVRQGSHEAPIAPRRVAGKPERVEHGLLGGLDGAGEERVQVAVGQAPCGRASAGVGASAGVRDERQEDLAAAMVGDRARPREPEPGPPRDARELRGPERYVGGD